MTAVATRQAAAGTPSLAMLQIDGPLASVLSLRLPAFGGSSVGTLAVDVLSQSAGASSVDVMHVVVMSSGDVYCEQKDELPMLAALSVAAFRGSLEHDSAAIFCKRTSESKSDGMRSDGGRQARFRLKGGFGGDGPDRGEGGATLTM